MNGTSFSCNDSDRSLMSLGRWTSDRSSPSFIFLLVLGVVIDSQVSVSSSFFSSLGQCSNSARRIAMQSSTDLFLPAILSTFCSISRKAPFISPSFSIVISSSAVIALKVKYFQRFPFYNYSYNQVNDTTIKLCTNGSQEKYASSLEQDYD